MARLMTSGAETGEVNSEGLTTATLTVQSANAYSGGFAFRAPTTGGSGDVTFTGVLGRTYYLRARMYVGAFPGAARDLINFFGVAGGAKLRVLTDGTLRMTDSANIQVGVSSSALSVGTWYMLEFAVNIGTGSIDTAEYRIDGISISAVTAQALGDNALTTVRIGPSGSTGATSWDIDDIALNDDQGASQNTWPGDGKVVMLLPVTDSATGTGWNLGTNTAPGGAGHSSLDNTPPVGVADLAVGSDPKQMRNATSNANVNIDMNMTTYTAAGLATGATVNVIVPITATAAPVSTGAKVGTVGVVSNPAITNINLAGASGAFYSGANASTYPTGWIISKGTTTYGATPTLGTAPVMRVTQVTSSTRIAMVCFMGMYVDYTPAVAAQVPYTNPYPQLLAQ